MTSEGERGDGGAVRAWAAHRGWGGWFAWRSCAARAWLRLRDGALRALWHAKMERNALGRRTEEVEGLYPGMESCAQAALGWRGRPRPYAAEARRGRTRRRLGRPRRRSGGGCTRRSARRGGGGAAAAPATAVVPSPASAAVVASVSRPPWWADVAAPAQKAHLVAGSVVSAPSVASSPSVESVAGAAVVSGATVVAAVVVAAMW